jgi:ribose transport system permease protein
MTEPKLAPAVAVGPDTVAAPPGRPTSRRDAVVQRVAAFWTLGVLVVIVVVFGIVNSAFLTQPAWTATAIAATSILLLALGQTFVIGTGGIDLSVGSVLGVSGMVSGYVMHRMVGEGGTGSWGIVLVGLVVALAVGAGCGLVNGLVITRLRVSPLIATLGMLGAAGGVSNLVGDGRQIGGLPAQLQDIGFATYLGGWLPLPVLISFLVAAGAWYTLAKTRFGRRTLAIGSSVDAADRAGINTSAHLVRVYALSGTMAAVAGFLVMTRLVAASPTAGQSNELMAIAAVVIGGSSLFGGRASIVGSVIGTFIIAVLQTGLIVIGVDPFWQVIAVGVVLVLAVWADQQRLRLVNRR